MKRKLKLFVISVVSAATLISASFTEDYFEISKNMEIFTSLYRELNIYYVDGTKPGALMKTGIDAMLKSLDPYTVYFPESKIEDYRFMTTGQYGGIGALVNTINGKITITEPYQGYPAAKSGLRAGDVIIEVNGKNVVGKNHEEINDLLTGQPGSDVEIKINRTGQTAPLTFKIKREEVKIPDVPYSTLLDAKTGYIKLSGFTQTASSDLRNAFNKLKAQGMSQLVLDLRGNGGGLLREAVNIVNFFVPKGTDIVSTKGKLPEWNKSYAALNEPLDANMPLIVLVDRMSASASEVVSGGLQDLDRAVVLGEESFGKGLVQQTKDIAYNTKLKLTVAKYYTPSGRCIQRLDYSHRDEKTGNVRAVSDTLIKPFKTRNGRTVYDGRGISPDVVVQDEEAAAVLEALINDWIIFDWVTQFRQKNESIDSADVFHLSDAQYNDFIGYATSRDFHYKTETEQLYTELKKKAQEEKYYSGSEKEFDQLYARIEPNKRSDMEKFKSQILPVIENEIVSRYYYQDGRAKHSLPADPYIKRAFEVFAKDYNGLLQGPGTRK